MHGPCREKCVHKTGIFGSVKTSIYTPIHTHPHVEDAAGIREGMVVGLLQVRAGGRDVKGHPNDLHPQLPGQLQEVPAALQGAAKRHAGLGRMGLGGELQQQPGKGQTHSG